MKALGSGRRGEQISVLSPKCDDRHELHHTNAQSRDSTGDTQACVSCEKALTETWIPGSIGAYENKNDWIDVGDLLFWAALSFADDPQMGTWKLNETKSKFAPGATKNHTVIYETAGDNVKVTADGT